MSCSSPQRKLEFLKKIRLVPREEKITVCLDFCFGRLTEQQETMLTTLALPRRRFTLSRAAQIIRSIALSEHQLKESALELAKRSLLEQNITGGDCFYTFLRVVRDYCRNKASDFLAVFANGRNLFVNHFLAFLNQGMLNFVNNAYIRCYNM